MLHNIYFYKILCANVLGFPFFTLYFLCFLLSIIIVWYKLFLIYKHDTRVVVHL